MMLNLQLREPSAGEIATPPMVRPEPVALAEPPAPVDVRDTLATGEEGEFEIVLGKRQLAGVLFVAIVILVVFSALSYLAGKAASPKKAIALPPPTPVLQSTTTQSTNTQITTPIPQATIVMADDLPPAVANTERETKLAPGSPNGSTLTTAVNPASTPAPPLFADPATGAVYLQMGAVEKGIAVIFVEGLRRRGFDAFVAPGPNEKIFRVLIGPLDHESYARVKESLDSIGLSTFARRYQQETPHPVQSKKSSGATDPKSPEPTEVSGPGGPLPLENSLGTLVDGAGLPVHVIH